MLADRQSLWGLYLLPDVLILVLLEYARRPNKNFNRQMEKQVLILVLLEYARRQQRKAGQGGQ